MTVLITGAHGCVGTALVEHLSDRSLRLLDREDRPDRETHVADVTDYDAIRPAFDAVESVVHLAANPAVDTPWDEVLRNNVDGTRTVLAAASDAGVERVVFASSNHVVGGYETEHAPALYEPDYDLTLDRDARLRPDSDYGSSKAYGEAACRQFVETREYPRRCYALRIASVRSPPYDHPYGDAERGVDAGEWERGSDEYERAVARLRATWLSRRDCAHLVDRCLADESVTYDVFYGVSDNPTRWFDVEHAREAIDYDPRDSSADFDGPPR